MKLYIRCNFRKNNFFLRNIRFKLTLLKINMIDIRSLCPTSEICKIKAYSSRNPVT